MKSVPRAVLDTDVVLSALVFPHGQLARLRLEWHLASFRPLASTATTQELVRALTYPKFRLTVEDQRELLADYLPYCTPVSVLQNHLERRRVETRSTYPFCNSPSLAKRTFLSPATKTYLVSPAGSAARSSPPPTS